MPAHPTFYVTRKVAEVVGPFELSWSTASDYDWMLRAVELETFSLARLNKIMVEMSIGGRSTQGISAHLYHNFQALQVRRKRLGAGLIDYALFAKPARKLGQFGLTGRTRRDTAAA